MVDCRRKQSLIEQVSKAYGEKNDCVVRATALACRMDYDKAHSIAKWQGRKHGGGVCTHDVIEHLRQLGYKIEETYPKQPNGSRYTPKTISRITQKGYYICVVNGHAFAVINGQILDWVNGRKHHIYKMYKIVKPKHLK